MLSCATTHTSNSSGASTSTRMMSDPIAKHARMQAISNSTHQERHTASWRRPVRYAYWDPATLQCSGHVLLLLASCLLMMASQTWASGAPTYPPPPQQSITVYNSPSTSTPTAQMPASSASSLTGLTATGIQIAATPDIKAELNERYAGEQYPNPKVKSMFEILPLLSNVVGVHVVHVPGTDVYLFMERPSGYHPNRTQWQIAGTYDLGKRVWLPVDTPDGLFCCGHTHTQMGDVVIVGGHRENAGFPTGMWSVRLFNYWNDSSRLYKVADMGWRRWYPTPTLLPDGKVLIMGGTQNVGAGSAPNPTFEIFDPAYPTAMPLPSYPLEPTYLASTRQNYYPFNYVLPTGDVLNFCSRVSRILHAQTGTYRHQGPNKALVAGPNRPGVTLSQFPYTSTSVVTALRPDNGYRSVDLIVFGGAPREANNDMNVLATRYSHRMTVSWSRRNGSMPWNYKFSQWTEEDMGFSRVMPDAVNLPNGDVILLNGAQTGCAGDSASGGGTRANFPTLWAQLYQPDKPVGLRYTTLAASTIPRMYHSIAVLTTNGTVLVGGCDRCSKLSSDVPYFNPPPSKAEYRNEIFYPPYYFDKVNKPRIISIDNDTNSDIIRMGYGQAFMIRWGAASISGYGGIPITSVSIVSPGACTHSFNSNQRVVFLPVLSVDVRTGTVWVKMPPNRNVATPQMYMLFIMNGKTYSTSRWIHLLPNSQG